MPEPPTPTLYWSQCPCTDPSVPELVLGSGQREALREVIMDALHFLEKQKDMSELGNGTCEGVGPGHGAWETGVEWGCVCEIQDTWRSGGCKGISGES